MRYNANELKHMALSSKKLCTKEGVLSLREKEGKLWNKTDVLTERWCRLVDNLFFYFKTKDVTSDPYGVFILEGSHVRKATNDSTNGCGFILEFDGDNRSTYFLANNPSVAQDWIAALENASYTQLKQRYDLLLRQKGDSESESAQSSSGVQNCETSSANSSPLLSVRKKISPKDYTMTLSDVEGSSDSKEGKKKKHHFKRDNVLPCDSYLPVLDLSLSCANLNINKIIEHKRNLKIKVYSSLPPMDNWTLVLQTETVKAAASIEFLLSISFYQSQLIAPQTLLRFYLCQSKESGSVESVGCVTCPVSDLLRVENPVVLDIEKANESIGKLHIHVVTDHMSAQIAKSSNESQLSAAVLANDPTTADGVKNHIDSRYGDISRISNLKSMYCHALSRTYRFPTTCGDYLSVQEIMLETRLSFHIPLLYLKLLIDQETRHIGTLNSINYLAKHLHEPRAKQIEERQWLIQQYQENVKNIVNHTRSTSCFKPSVQKAEKELEFVATNLHLQRMRVQHSDCISVMSLESVAGASSGPEIPGVYDIITVGAAAAHCQKFKQGGLLSHISASDGLKKGKEHILSTLMKHDHSMSERMDLSSLIQSLYTEAKTLIETLQTMFSAGKECKTVPPRKSAATAISNLSEKICRLVLTMDDENLCRSVVLISNRGSDESGVASTLVSAATSLVTRTSIEWEELKSSVKTTLATLVKAIHLMLDAADGPLLDLGDGPEEVPSPSYDEILEQISQVSFRLSKVVNISMQGHALSVLQGFHETPNVTYRRDVVFSQVLSSCVCGIVTNICSALGNPKRLHDIAYNGILVQFESLLSTYGNEMGMLEDYIVGVHDLQKISFCCEKAPQQDGESLEHLLPTLHGTRNKLTVRLHMDPDSFDQLPEELKRGDEIKVIPIMFNVGINEEQSIAEKFGKTSLQEYINMDSCSRLSAYYDNMKKYDVAQSVHCPRNPSIEDRVNSLRKAVHLKKNKNVEILHLASEVCRHLSGVRITSCKSAKDRTAMSVTLEQVQVLVQNHELSLSMFSSALDCMRSQGTRRENTKKNVGVRKYAFTSVQLKTFPKQYRPPDGTYGKGES